MKKSTEAILIPNQIAAHITTVLIKVFSHYGIPDILHSDQGGRNFVSTILLEMLNTFGVTKSRTIAYHPSGDGLVERFNRALLQMLGAYVQQHNNWEKYSIYPLYCMLIELPSFFYRGITFPTYDWLLCSQTPITHKQYSYTM